MSVSHCGPPHPHPRAQKQEESSSQRPCFSCSIQPGPFCADSHLVYCPAPQRLDFGKVYGQVGSQSVPWTASTLGSGSTAVINLRRAHFAFPEQNIAELRSGSVTGRLLPHCPKNLIARKKQTARNESGCFILLPRSIHLPLAFITQSLWFSIFSEMIPRGDC